MGPEITTTSSSNIKVINLPRLAEDGSNWVTYKERIINNLTSKGLMRHVKGLVKPPATLEEREGAYFKAKSTTALTEKELDDHYTELDTYETKQAQVRDVIYETVSKSVFLEVKNEATATDVWKKVISIHETKGTMSYTDTLTQLSNMRYSEDKSMHSHISAMQELRERLADTGPPISEDQFSAYIRASLTPDYRPLLTSIMSSACATKATVALHDLIAMIYEEADNKAALKRVDEANENAALAASSSKNHRMKGKGRAKGGSSSKSNKADRYCKNCKKKGHLDEDCFAPGGGKETDAPEWWKKKFAKGGSSTAAVAETDEGDYAFLAQVKNVVLVITSNFQEEAHSADIAHHGIIINCGASRHFTPDHLRLLDYKEISPVPIRTANGRSFNALGRGNMKISFPMGNKSPTTVTLINVYYCPSLTFTLLSVTCMAPSGKGHLALAVFRCFSCPMAS